MKEKLAADAAKAAESEAANRIKEEEDDDDDDEEEESVVSEHNCRSRRRSSDAVSLSQLEMKSESFVAKKTVTPRTRSLDSSPSEKVKKQLSVDSGNDASSEDSNDSKGKLEGELVVSWVERFWVVELIANLLATDGNMDHSEQEKPVSTTAASFSLAKLLGSQSDVKEWTGSDQSLFRVLHKVFLNNYCAIAQIMLTKSCQQVCIWYLFFGGILRFGCKSSGIEVLIL